MKNIIIIIDIVFFRYQIDPIAPSLTIKAVEFPDEDVLPIGSNVTISCVSNFSKEDFGLHYYGQPYWIQVYHNDNYVKDCGGGDGDAEDSMVCTFFIRNATKEDSGTYDCWSHNQITCTEGGINLDFRGEPKDLMSVFLFKLIDCTCFQSEFE